ncbi:DUF4440 domain-containing protein [Erythrobacter arachoides]|uniref:DUF4440 domain-containing protein n=1 Tax=Aurantiacibacter arachoides TaxID=1850444 RepID=A0A844ZZE3_9SPHN|nr:nuclear transport factor 2 family protein [Aurantiacibacter arachoides]MXO93651.1 DUF4440 domain-containing protein [Aurantiacibacter arachoides]GGD47746.1 hypothetical protein GCM10011411_04320 [Aurantiacibacter arachoides]
MRFWFPRPATRTVQTYINAMNARDVMAMVALMDEDVLLVDSSGREVRGREAARTIFSKLFAEARQFELRIDTFAHSGDQVLMTGKLISDHPAISDSRHFRARADDLHVHEWQSYGAHPVQSLARIMREPVNSRPVA